MHLLGQGHQPGFVGHLPLFVPVTASAGTRSGLAERLQPALARRRAALGPRRATGGAPISAPFGHGRSPYQPEGQNWHHWEPSHHGARQPDRAKPRPPERRRVGGMIDRVEFGRTGHQSSRVIFGAAALGAMRQDRADRLLESSEAFGVNHLDTAAGYGDSELRLAPWLAKHRDRFFLATKTGDRSADSARASLERSLTRLGVDHVDLIQLHNLVEEDE